MNRYQMDQVQPCIDVLVGAQWGDEGKGKWVDVLAEKADYVVRYQGGNNAGHTLWVDGKKTVLNLLPSGVLRGKIAVLTSGVAIDPLHLQNEMKPFELTPELFWISNRAHVITPWHKYYDGLIESKRSKPIGTTKRGIGPCYADRVARSGLTIANYICENSRNQWLEQRMSVDPEFSDHVNENQALWQKFFKAAESIQPFVCAAEKKIRSAARKSKKILIEGAQGTMLDVNHGTYPYVTSSCTLTGGVLSTIGLHRNYIRSHIGVAKAYLTRVGEGPMPTELNDEVGKNLAEKGHEFGATTGRARRCGWLDLIALKHAVEVNGLDELYINKVDILSGFKKVKMAIAYKDKLGKEIYEFPDHTKDVEQVDVVYKEFEGWNEDFSTIEKAEQLPQSLLKFVKFIEDFCKINVTGISTGPRREDLIFL